MTYDVAVVGGGLGGLVASLVLARAGRRVALVEKRTYPFHKVCGEYLSEETRPFLEGLGVDIDGLGAARIRQLEVVAPSGKKLEAPLKLGGFGISRYLLDHTLYQMGVDAGVADYTGRKCTAIERTDRLHTVALADGTALEASLVIGSWGKRTALDKTLERPFMQRQEPYVGVKYHLTLDFPRDRIALYNFPGGYCGLSAVEPGRWCLAYLTTREALRRHGTIQDLEDELLASNPALASVLDRADVLYEKPEVINAFSFARKEVVTGGIWHIGDAAGLITPLCGNGMAMAIHGAKLLTDTVLQAGAFRGGTQPDAAHRQLLEAHFARIWQQQFGRRLWWGRVIQRWLFGQRLGSEVAVRLLKQAPGLTQRIIRLTHGQPF